jgi:hypothetical protein
MDDAGRREGGLQIDSSEDKAARWLSAALALGEGKSPFSCPRRMLQRFHKEECATVMCHSGAGERERD